MRVSHASSTDFVRTHPLRRDSQENLFKFLGDSHHDSSKVIESKKQKLIPGRLESSHKDVRQEGLLLHTQKVPVVEKSQKASDDDRVVGHDSSLRTCDKKVLTDTHVEASREVS